MKKNDILTEIMANKRFEIDFQKRTIPLEELQNNLNGNSHRRSMRDALAASPTGIIAEFKRRSPSKGWINHDARPEEVVPAYEAAGAAALSILTDERFFGGTLRDIRRARPLVGIPILRKEFIIDEYQLYQAAIVGADAILLIAAALEEEQCHELTGQAHELGLEVLLEIHSEAELKYISPQTDMVGINNRNLGSFHTSIENSFHLAQMLPPGKLLISESGIDNPETVARLRRHNFRGFLIGEAFMKTEKPGDTLRTFITQLTKEGETA